MLGNPLSVKTYSDIAAFAILELNDDLDNGHDSAESVYEYITRCLSLKLNVFSKAIAHNTIPFLALAILCSVSIRH